MQDVYLNILDTAIAFRPGLESIPAMLALVLMCVCVSDHRPKCQEQRMGISHTEINLRRPRARQIAKIMSLLLGAGISKFSKMVMTRNLLIP